MGYYGFKNRTAYLRSRDKWRKDTGSFSYSRRPWTEEEDLLVLEHSVTDRELSAMIERSVTAIQIRRNALKKKM